MLVQIPVCGYFEVNTYLYADDTTRHGFLIDPGAEPERLLDAIEANAVTVDQILLTHGHFDHMGAADTLHRVLGVPIRMTAEGRAYVENPYLNLSASCGPAIILPDVDYFDAAQRPVLTAGTCRLEVVPVPGHTPDSVMFYAPQEGIAFVGDTIFQGTIGTTRFPGGDIRQLVNSIMREILPLPDTTLLYSGHSDPTSLGVEKAGEQLQALIRKSYSC